MNIFFFSPSSSLFHSYEFTLIKIILKLIEKCKGPYRQLSPKLPTARPYLTFAFETAINY